MPRKINSVLTTDERFPAPESISPDPAEIATDKGKADCPPLDFTSPEFNVTDDLDDNIGNYRHFQKLDNVVTADMRHQKKRKRMKSAGPRDDTIRQQDKNTASATDDKEMNLIDLSPVTITSRGKVLIIDTDSGRAGDCGKFLSERGLACTICLKVKDDINITLPLPAKHACRQANSVVVRGGFGGFIALAASSSREEKPVRLPENKNTSFDLVLDLLPTPSFAGQQLPLGYYAPGNDQNLLAEALAELPEMKGVFTKPQFTVFLPDKCLHGRSRTQSCWNCLQACPVGAVRLEKEVIYLDPYLCQGCGSCALVCPADAIRMINPSGKDLLTGVRDLLANHPADTDAQPVLVIHSKETSAEELLALQGSGTGRRPLFFAVEEIGRIGYEIMLSALAYGAGAVVVVCGRDTSPETIRALKQQIDICGAILKGLHLPEDRIRLLVVPSGSKGADKTGVRISSSGALSSVPAASPAIFSPDNARRSLVRLAVHHLARVSPTAPAEISLPDGTPFGGVLLDKDACTLCMACAGACPTGALTAGGDVPRLNFSESDCHQCGLCLEACPEAALQLLPRLLCTGDKHGPPAVLQEAEPFTCIECGLPFASQAMIHRLQDKLAGHWMYRSERQLRRLRMCRTCSTRDALLAKDF
jgi:ferredoxin